MTSLDEKHGSSKHPKNNPNHEGPHQSLGKLPTGHRKRSRMEILTYSCGVLFALAGIAGGVLLRTDHRDAGLWAYCVAACFLVIGAFGWFQDRLWKRDAAKAGVDQVNSALLKSQPPIPDLNALERRYPFGFIIFHKRLPESQFEPFITNGIAHWDIKWPEVKVEPIADGKLRLFLFVNKVELTHGVTGKKLRIINIGFDRNVLNVPSISFLAVFVRRPGDPRLYFEILDNHPIKPIYVFGLSTEDLDPTIK